MNSDIITAIKNQNIIQFSYDGKIRVVEPFCYGRNSKGNDVLRAFQIGGYSSSGEPVGWRLYIVFQMSCLLITDKRFTQIRPYYNPNDKGMIQIYCAV